MSVAHCAAPLEHARRSRPPRALRRDIARPILEKRARRNALRLLRPTGYGLTIVERV